MSFLRGVGAGKEGAYFYRESKQAVTRHLLDNPPSPSDHSPPSDHNSQADVLPEVLKHSLPLKPDSTSSPSQYSASKWSLHFDPNNSSASFSRLSINPLTSNLSLPQVPIGSKRYDPNNAPVATPDVLNPLTAHLSLPQATFGPKRWKLPSQEHSVVASTANEMRIHRVGIIINPEKVKDASEGLTQIGQALAIATASVFGGAIVVFALAASKLQLQNISDIRTKVRELSRPKFEMMNERVVPLKKWAEGMRKKWHIDRTEDIKEKPLVKELFKFFNVKT